MKPRPGVQRRSTNSPVQFSHGCLAPNPEARDDVSFGLEDILYTAASDSGNTELVEVLPLHPPPYTVWGARSRSASRQRPRKRVDLKRPNKPPAMASLGRS